MNIYVGHPKSIDYENGLYPTIEQTMLFQNEHVVLPHKHTENSFASKTFLKEKCDLMIAEGSEHATGLGIELGWVDIFQVPIICIYRKGSKPTGSYKVLTTHFIEYNGYDDLIVQLNNMYHRFAEMFSTK